MKAIKIVVILCLLVVLAMSLCSCKLIARLFGNEIRVEFNDDSLYFYTDITEEELRSHFQVFYVAAFKNRSIGMEVSDYEITTDFEEGINEIKIQYRGKTHTVKKLFVDRNKVSLEGDFLFCEIKGHDYLLEYRGNAKDVSLPERSRSYIVYDWVFAFNTTIESLAMGDSVTQIGNEVFTGSSLKSIDIGKNLTDICSGAFTGCQALEYVNVHSVKQWCEMKFYSTLPMNQSQVQENVTLPDGTNRIQLGDGNSLTFVGGYNGIIVPSSTFEIKDGNVYYYNDKGELLFILPLQVSNPIYFAKSLYVNGEKLEDLVIPSDVTTVSVGFDYSDIKSVRIHKNVSGISGFSNCENLEKVIIDDVNQNMVNINFKNTFGDKCKIYTEYNGAYYMGNDENPYLIMVSLEEKEALSFTPHSNTKAIAGRSFAGVDKIVEIIVPDSVEYIGSYLGLNNQNVIIRSGSSLRYIGKQNTLTINGISSKSTLEIDNLDGWYYLDKDGERVYISATMGTPEGYYFAYDLFKEAFE